MDAAVSARNGDRRAGISYERLAGAQTNGADPPSLKLRRIVTKPVHQIRALNDSAAA
jgi:hypothetical protein